MNRTFLPIAVALLLSTGASAQQLQEKPVVKATTSQSVAQRAKTSAKVQKIKRAVPQADLTQYTGRTFYGNMSNSDAWRNVSIGAVPYGVYSYTIGTDNTYQAVSTNLMYDFMASAFARDRLVGVQVLSVMGAFNGARYQELDGENFNQVFAEVYDGSYGLVPNVMTYDPTTDRIYAAMYNDALNGLNWAVYNRNTHRFDIIHAWTNSFQPATLGCDNEGNVYGIDIEGYYYQLDKATGEAEMLGETGVTPVNYVQAMGYDNKTNTFIWHAVDTQGSCLYIVDTESGEARQLKRLTLNEQVSSLFLRTNEAKDKAPAAISDLKFAYSGTGATAGNITFTVPSTTYDGSSLTGNVTVTTYLDGNKLASVSATAGQALTYAVDLSNDNHYVDVVVKNAAGVSPVNCLYEYAGYDVPLAPTGATLNVADGNMNISWTAPTGGVNNGYIDFDNLTYTIVRMPDNVTVATDHKGTTFTEPIPAALKRYSYRISANNGASKQSEYVETEGILAGNSFTVPYSEDFQSEETVPLFTILNFDENYNKWAYNTYNKCFGISTSEYNGEGLNNDWFITPGIYMEKGKSLTATFNMRNTFAGYKEDFQILIGTDVNDTTTFRVLNTYEQFDNKSTVEPISNDFTVDNDGTYYLAVKVYSPKTASGLWIYGISVESNGTVTSPLGVSDLTLTPQEDGDLVATLNWNNPATSVDGNALTGELKANIYRDGAEAPIATIDVTAGAAGTYTDNAVPTVGNHTYTVALENASGEGKRNSVSAFVGVFTPTYTENFDTDEFVQYYTTTTNLGTEDYPALWKWNSYNKYLDFSQYATSESDTWLFFPAIKLDSEAVYQVDFTWNNSIYGDAQVDANIAVGQQPEASAQTHLASLPKTSYGQNYPATADIVTTATGKYYPAVHITTSSPNVYLMPNIDNVCIKYVTSSYAPLAVENLTLTPDAAGALKADLAFTAPTQDFAKRDLPDGFKIEIFRNGNALPTKTFDNVKAGEALTWTDNEPLRGMNDYIIVPVNEAGRGKATNDSVWVGVDIPNGPENYKVVGNSDNHSAILTWEAPTEGIHGGILDESLAYIVFEYFPEGTTAEEKMKIINPNVKALTYTVTPSPADSEQTIHYYGVMPFTSAGYEMIGLRDVILGDLYKLPFQESFANGAEATNLWTIDSENATYAAWQEAQDGSDYQAQDGDNGYAMFYNGYYSYLYINGGLYTPKFELDNSGNKVLSFWYWAGNASTAEQKPYLQVFQNVNDGEYVALSDIIDVTVGDGGWKQVTLPINNPAGANYGRILFRAGTGNRTDHVVIDNITISGASAVNGITNNSPVVSTTYVSVDGKQSTTPFEGINMIVTRHADGSQEVVKRLLK